MSPQAHARIDEKHSSARAFDSRILGKLEMFHLQTFFSNYRKLLVAIFFKVSAMAEKRVVCKLVSTGLYCACVAADIASLIFFHRLCSSSLGTLSIDDEDVNENVRKQ